MRTLTTLVLTALVAAPLAAQTSRTPNVAVQRAVESITETDYRARVALLSHDSMRGRGTPSPELEEVATWIAGEFRRFGLRPAGDSGSFLQRYRMRRSQVDTAQSFVMAMGGSQHLHWGVGREAIYVTTFDGSVPASAVSGPVWLVVGAPADTARPFADAPRGSIVVLMLRGTGLAGINAYLGKADAAGIAGIVVLVATPRPQFLAQMQGSLRASQLELVSAGDAGIPLFLLHDSSAVAALRAAGEDPAAMRAGQRNGVRRLGNFEATMNVRLVTVAEESAPNVIGVLEGSDPQLRHEYLFFTSHMDHVGVAGMGNGCTARGADSICNGADDDASGTAGVVELAEAFSRMNPRPRRSMVFMAVSGEERGLWGSEHYANHPTLPLGNTVANINLDMIGRNWSDTISVIGKEHSTLGETANRVNREHPELRMSLVDDLWPGERFYFRSDHYNFARKGVPILFFFNGVHPQYHQVNDTVDLIDAEKATRIVRMIFYIGLDVANSTERPQWNPQSRAQIVQ